MRQIQCSCKCKAGVCQGATDPALPPPALPAPGCQPPHRASLLVCCQTTPTPALGGTEGRGLLLHSPSSQTWLCWNELNTARSTLGTDSKRETLSAGTTPVPLSFTSMVVPDSRGTYAHLMDNLSIREMGKSLPSSSSSVWGLQSPSAGCGG